MLLMSFSFDTVLQLLMSSLLAIFGCESVRGKSITYQNNDSCKQKLVIVRKLHIEYDFSLKFSFFTITRSPFIINHPETLNCCNVLFVSTFVGDFGRELSCERAARL